MMTQGSRCAATLGYETQRLRRRVIQACDADERSAIHIQSGAPGQMELSEPRHKSLSDPAGGAAIAALSAGQRADVTSLIDQYFAVFHESIGRPHARSFEREAARVRVGWAGGREAGEPHYYRIQRSGMVIEYTNSGAHMHTLIRADDSGP